jgi:hypothetical protein
MQYAQKVVGQIQGLLEAGVPPENISVVGASKGAGIAAYVSSQLKNEKVNYVLLAICNPDSIKEMEHNSVVLYGNVLSIYDYGDQLAGSCQELFTLSTGKGLARHAEIVLHVGIGHGILYTPMDEWVLPTIQWVH